MSKEERRVPELRFKGFFEDWEQHKLGDFSEVTKLAGFEFTKHVVYSNDGEIPAIRGLNIKNGSFDFSDLKYIDDSEFSKLNRSKLNFQDIVFTYVGTIGEAAIVPKGVNWYLAPNVARIRSKSIKPEFLFQKLISRSYKNTEINKWITSSSQPALSMENIRKFNIIHPELAEQNKIGEFLKSIDKLINLHQRKINMLKKIRQEYLNLTFPKDSINTPEIYFQCFKSLWKKRTFKEILETHPNKKYLATVKPGGKYMVIQQGDHPLIGYANGEPFKNYKSITLFGDHTASLHKPNHPFFVATDGLKILSAGEMSGHFLYTLLERYKPNTQGYKRHFSILKDSICYLTDNKEEQLKIGLFFKESEKVIALHQKKLSMLEHLKQSYLRKMFL